MDTEGFIVNIKTIKTLQSNNVKARFDTLNYEVARLLQKGIKKSDQANER